MATDGGWKPTLSLDRESRRAKASKIVALIEHRRRLTGSRLLEIGTGGGFIASLLSERVGTEGGVWSVDIDDMRQETQGYRFDLVKGTELPFDDNSFDVVVSNHTIEHVGDVDQQRVHLCEIARTLRPDGLAYLSSPTRWALVEPHFKVPMLGWLPPAARTAALRLSRRGQVYDISPRSRGELLRLISEAGLSAEDVTIEALEVMAQTEPGLVAKTASKTPRVLLRTARGALPTMVFIITHAPGQDA
jgi:SAM-dependent methyltransferase